MSQFEYIIVFLSILVALAVAELIAGFGRIIRHREHVNIYWIHVAWMVLMMIAIMQGWWSIWGTRTLPFDNFMQFIILLLPRLLTVLVAYLLSPQIVAGVHFDMRDYYYRQSRWVAWLFSLSLTLVAFSRFTFGEEELLSPINAIRVLVLIPLISLGFTQNPRFHGTAVVVVAGALLGAIWMTYTNQ